MTENERVAAELALIPELFMRAWRGINFPSSTEGSRALGDLVTASHHALLGLTLPERAVVSNHIERLGEAAAVDAKFTDRIGLVAFHVTKILTDHDVLDLGAGPLARGVAVMLGALEDVAQSEAEIDRAQKQATRLIRAAQRRGLFPDFALEVRT